MLSFISGWLKDSILSKSILVIYAIINSHLDCNSAFYLNMKQSDLQRHLLTDYSEQITLLSPLTPQNIELSSRLQCFWGPGLPGPQKVLQNEALQGEKKSYLPEKEPPCGLICSSWIPQSTPLLPPRGLCEKLNILQKLKLMSTDPASPGMKQRNKPQVTNVTRGSKYFKILMEVKRLLQWTHSRLPSLIKIVMFRWINNNRNYNIFSASATYYSAILFLTFIAVLAMQLTRESICKVIPSSLNEIKRQYIPWLTCFYQKL